MDVDRTPCKIIRMDRRPPSDVRSIPPAQVDSMLASIRHLRLQPHDESICAYCTDDPKKVPNPFQPELVLLESAAHKGHSKYRCPNCLFCDSSLDKCMPLDVQVELQVGRGRENDSKIMLGRMPAHFKHWE